MELRKRLMELGLEGFECSQMMMAVAMETEGMENPDLLRAMSGLTGGMGHSGGLCGALTGGCCVLGLFTGKGEAEEMEHNRSREIIQEYLTWFEASWGNRFGTSLCQDIVQGDFSQCMTVCLPMIESCCEKIMEMLAEYELTEM
ncbi:MAG: DVU_1555 family C-GCAxxG-C-C protein [Ruminococcus sp.]|jgi:C_GCAxxG_C_C family probable redox protein